MDATPTPTFTIAEAASLMAAHKLSPVELTRHCLDRIAATENTLHPFIRLTEDRAMADARAAEARIMKGESKGRLDGIPIAHKDIYDTAGIATTAHSKLLQDYVPQKDAVAVASLAAAGTIMLGKLATHEFAMGGPSFDLPWPPPRNPWDTTRFTGGSSSGTGAAVAAGLILGGTGSDTGGSIRNPSALCGIAGIKPTYGLVPRTGIQPLSQSLDHAGPMAWTVEDCAILLQAMAGHDPADPASANHPIPDFCAGLNDGVKGLKIGLVRHFHETDTTITPATQQGIDNAIQVFRSLGAEIVDVTLPPLADFQACGLIILAAEAYAVHEPWLQSRFNDYGELLRMRLAIGVMVDSTDYVQALRRRRELCAMTAAAIQGVDILLTAAQPSEALPIDRIPRWALWDSPSLSIPFNVTGYPAMSVCSGFGAGGLPVAIQLVAKPFEDALLLRTAHAFEAATPWRDKRPVLIKESAAA